MQELTLESVKAMLAGYTPAQIEEVRAKVMPVFKRWAPQPGPQTLAYFSDADELLYGGAAGGGKTDLLLGLATTAHQRSVIFRNQSTDLVSLFERMLDIETNPRKKDMQVKSMVTSDGRRIETGHLELPGSERSHMGRAKDFIGFDEAALLAELRVNFVSQWLRSTDPKQRKRIVFATNPPIPEIRDGMMTDTAVGDWLIRWFAPWLDPTFPNPAEQGELRWCYMIAEGDRLTTVWVEKPGAYNPVTGEHRPNATSEDIDLGKVSIARSRTFIRSLVKDNVFLKGTGYAEKLSSQPEPMRSMLLLGDFTIKGEDHPMQVIPTQWVLKAQERWHERSWEEIKRLRMLVLAGDIAQGGVDTTVLAPLFDTDFFEELVTMPGSATPTGNEVQSMILTTREDRALIVLDGQGGWAGSTRDLLQRDQGIEAEMFISSGSDGSWDPMMIYKYANNRAKMWWEFRLALDPKSGFEICLPPSVRLRAQLCVPHYTVKGKELLVESKDQVIKRLRGTTSTDEADAVLMAWQYRDQALSEMNLPQYDIVERLNGRVPRKGRGHEPVPMEDPRGDW